jgi:hypothetical protein
MSVVGVKETRWVVEVASGRFVESVETLGTGLDGIWQNPSRRADTVVCAEEQEMLRRVVSRRFRSLLRCGVETGELPVNALEGRASLREEPELFHERSGTEKPRTGKSPNGMPGGSEPE